MFALISLAVTVFIIGYTVLTARGTVSSMGLPLGSDFSNVWAAGHMALNGNAAQAWDWPAHYAVQQALHHDPRIPFFGWHYPPPFLLVATALAFLPYLPALILWQVTTLALAVKTLRAILPGQKTLMLALGAPVVFICLTHGHNGFLTASLLCGGLMLLDSRQFVAGLLLGCMVYKPQFGLVLPLLLVAGGHWRAIAGACVSSAALIAATFIIFGWPVWTAFIDSLPLTQSVVIEQGGAGWHKIQSAFAAARFWGAGIPVAWAIQMVVTGCALAMVFAVSRQVTGDVRNVVVVAATLLSTPYVLDYDFVPLTLAIAFMVRQGAVHGFLPYEKTVLGVIWAVPLVGRAVMQNTGFPIDLLSVVAMMALAARRAVHFDRAFGFVRMPPFLERLAVR